MPPQRRRCAAAMRSAKRPENRRFPGLVPYRVICYIGAPPKREPDSPALSQHAAMAELVDALA